MERIQAPGGDFTIFARLADGTNRPILRQGTRRDDKARTVTPFAITYAYLPGGGFVEHESMELCVLDEIGQAVQIGSKYVVREHPAGRGLRPLKIFSRLGKDPVAVWVKLETLGHTLEGGEKGNEREPWARFTIDDPDVLKMAFGNVDTSGRQPNDTGSYVILANTPERQLIEHSVFGMNGRDITITEVGEMTLNFGPDINGQAGPLLKAFFRKVKWVEGDLMKPQGMMA